MILYFLKFLKYIIYGKFFYNFFNYIYMYVYIYIIIFIFILLLLLILSKIYWEVVILWE